MTGIRGICPVCDRLVILMPGDWKPLGRQRWYWPVPHQDDAGNECDGAKRPL